MAAFKKLHILQTIHELGMLPLFYESDLKQAQEVLAACYRGGARVLEFTNRGDYAHEIFGELNRYALAELPGMILGIGSVTDAGTASLYMQLGANFIVSASLREDIAKVCNRRQVPYMPGCGSLTEIGLAEELGCELVKLFPGSVYGPGFIKAIKGPQAWTNIMPTGGVSPDKNNLSTWFDAGAFCVGMGSKLIKKDKAGAYLLNEIEQLTKESLESIRTLRS